MPFIFKLNLYFYILIFVIIEFRCLNIIFLKLLLERGEKYQCEKRLAASHMCPDQGSNAHWVDVLTGNQTHHLWGLGMTLQLSQTVQS